MAVSINRVFLFGQVLAQHFPAPFLESHRPARHAIVELRPFLGAGQSQRAPSSAPGVFLVLYHFILIRGNHAVALPDRRSHGAIRANGVAGPVSGRVLQVQPPRVGHVDHLEAELARQEAGESILRHVVSRSPVQHENADFFAVRSRGNFGSVHRLVDYRRNIPIQFESPDSDDGFLRPQRDVWLCQNLFRGLDQLGASDSNPFPSAHLLHIAF